jgi:hypothetical protein
MALSSVSVVVSSLLLNRYKKPVVKEIELRNFGYNSSIGASSYDHAICCPCLLCSRQRSQSPLAVYIGGATIEPLMHSQESEPLLKNVEKLSPLDDARIQVHTTISQLFHHFILFLMSFLDK